MAEPARKFQDIEPDIRPHFGVIQGGGQSTPRRASLKAVNDQESNIKNPVDKSADLKSAEESPSASYKNNYTGPSSKPLGFMAAAKKKSPIIAIILTLFGGGIGIGFVSGPALLSQSLFSNLVQTYNIQETSATLRTNKIIAKKMSGNLTTGSCDVILFACRFSRPSNRFLSQLEKNGITAIDSAGDAIKAKGLWNPRPTQYKYTNSSGDDLIVEAKDLYKTMVGNPELRDAFHKSSKTRFMSLADSIFDSIKLRFGFSTNNKFTDVVSNETAAIDDAATVDGDGASNNLDDIIDDNVTVDDGGIGATADALADSTIDAGVDSGVALGSDMLADTAGDQISDVVTNTVTDATETLARNAKGSGDTISLAAGIICGIADVPGMMTKAVRGFQMAQLVKYATLFLATFGAIRAGDATPENASTVGKLLTETVNGKSAMDSFGVRTAINGDTVPQDNKYKKFVPGASIIGALGSTVAVANSDIKKSSCATMSNPLTGVAINSTLMASGGATLGATALAAGINIAAAMTIGLIVEKAAPTIIGAIMSVIPVQDILGYFVGDLTKNLSGENVGDALVSGASHVMGQTANAGGNMPLTVNQAIAYGETKKQVELAYAEEDRATKSPFDITSSNTMLGSIVQRIVPYFAKSNSIGSASNIIASIGNVVTGSFGSILKPLTASATSGDEYKLCEDPEMKENDIAAGPFCNIMYGVPTEYLNKDPTSVVNELAVSDNIDPETGDIIADSELDRWVNLCTGGDTFEARNCKIDDKTANYALYTIDQRVQKSMDEEPAPSTPSSTTETGGSAVGDNEQPANTAKKDKGWTLKSNVDYSGVACADGSTDKGSYTHPIKKFTIKLCETKLGRVSSLISQRVLDAIAAAKKDGVTLAGSTWRSYEAQQGLYRDNCARGHCEPPTARPGNSQHERGIGTDFGNVGRHGSGPVWDWLVKNGAKYGYINLPSEGWHWSMSGG